MDIDEKKSIDIGRLYYNTPVLEYKLIYPSGLLPPRSVVSEALTKYGACLLLAVLFAVMIYGAFNVWNNKELKEIALLKSVGMTEKQVKKMVMLKSLKLAFLPIVLGTILSYLTANLLLYLMWLNNSISYNNMAGVLGEEMLGPKFHLIYPSLGGILLIILLSFFTVYLSAIVPAKRSSKIKIIEGLNEIPEKNVSLGKSKIRGKIEKTLAKDYYRSYKSTYRVINLSMVISALVITSVLVSQSYRSMLEKYDSYKSPYNFSSDIFSKDEINKDMIKEIKNLKGIDQIHIYKSKDFKFYVKDNSDFISNELKEALDKDKKNTDRLYAKIYALSDQDFNKLLKENNYGKEKSYLLLNKISNDDNSPYAFTKYIPINDKKKSDVTIKYSEDSKDIKIKIDGNIKSMPYNLNGYNKNEIAIFTNVKNLNLLFKNYGQDKAYPYNYYTIKIKSDNNLKEVSENAENIITSFYSKTDHYTKTDILNEATDKEQKRNENLLNAGIQIILIIIALSNAYNSFQSNLRARSRDFKLLETAGMTEKQIKKMILSEAKILLSKVLSSYIIVYFLVISIRAYRSKFEFAFAVKQLLINMNYLPILIVFAFIVVGILLAIQSGIKTILSTNINDSK